MALRTAWFRPGGRSDRQGVWQTGGSAGPALAIALVIALGGCSGPVEAWRSLSGVNKNDPDPQTAPFSGNLAAGEAAPYPNLASVPPPPVRATNTAERQKLTQSLIADRNATAADAGPLPPRPAADAQPAQGLPPATLVSAPAAAPSNVQSPNAAAAAPHSRTALNSAPSGRRAAGEPPEPGPLDSSLEMPQIRSVPEPEAARPPPPPPALASVPRPVAVLPAASVASAMPQPAPPEPVLAPVAPPPAAAKPDSQRKTEPKRPPAFATVATLQIPAAMAAPVGQDRAQIARVAALYKDNPGTVRVLAYAVAASGGDPLDSYRAALDRAQAVAKALADAGIPAGKIQTEAAPAAGAKAGRVEIQFIQ